MSLYHFDHQRFHRQSPKRFCDPRDGAGFLTDGSCCCDRIMLGVLFGVAVDFAMGGYGVWCRVRLMERAGERCSW